MGLDSKDTEDAKIIAEEKERLAEEEERIGEEVKIENEELIAKEKEKEEEKEGKGFLDFMFSKKEEKQKERKEIAALDMVLVKSHKLKKKVITFMTNNLPYLRAKKLGFVQYRRLDDIKTEQLEKLIEDSSKIKEWLESKDEIGTIEEEIETVADSYFDISGRNGTLDSLRTIIKPAKEEREERERKDKE